MAFNILFQYCLHNIVLQISITMPSIVYIVLRQPDHANIVSLDIHPALNIRLLLIINHHVALLMFRDIHQRLNIFPM